MAHGPQKKPLDFGGNPDHIKLGLGYGYGYGYGYMGLSDTHDTRYVLPVICLTVTVLQDQSPWQRCALY